MHYHDESYVFDNLCTNYRIFDWREISRHGYEAGNLSQSNVVFGFLLVAFLIFITARGELPIYLGFLLA